VARSIRFAAFGLCLAGAVGTLHALDIRPALDTGVTVDWSARREGHVAQYAAGVRQTFRRQAGIDFWSLTLGNGFRKRA
jgi:hypothetical protein